MNSSSVLSLYPVRVKWASGRLGELDYLKIHLWIPVAVIQNDDICSVQIDAQATCSCRQEEDELLAAFPVVVINLVLSVFPGCVTYDKGVR